MNEFISLKKNEFISILCMLYEFILCVCYTLKLSFTPSINYMNFSLKEKLHALVVFNLIYVTI